MGMTEKRKDPEAANKEYAERSRDTLVGGRARVVVGDGREHTGAGKVAAGGMRVTELDWGARQRAYLRRKQTRKETDD